MNLDDENLESLLKEHVDHALTSQLGRVEARFRSHGIRVTPPRRHMALWTAGALATAAAVWAIAMMKPASPRPSAPAEPRKSVQVAKTDSDARDVQFTTYTQTLDDGLVYLDDQTPVRQLRRQELQQVRWLDDDGKTQMKITVPREQVLLVESIKN